jgi:hypothetical protein
MKVASATEMKNPEDFCRKGFSGFFATLRITFGFVSACEIYLLYHRDLRTFADAQRQSSR